MADVECFSIITNISEIWKEKKIKSDFIVFHTTGILNIHAYSMSLCCLYQRYANVSKIFTHAQ